MMSSSARIPHRQASAILQLCGFMRSAVGQDDLDALYSWFDDLAGVINELGERP